MKITDQIRPSESVTIRVIPTCCVCGVRATIDINGICYCNAHDPSTKHEQAETDREDG
jgi:hypothetical protein